MERKASGENARADYGSDIAQANKMHMDECRGLQKVGVKGEAVVIDRADVKDVNWSGTYLRIQKLPNFDRYCGAQAIFLQDEDALESLRGLQDQGVVIVYKAGASLVRGAHVPKGNELVRAMGKALGSDTILDNFIIITSDTDSYSLEHELRHYNDERNKKLEVAKDFLGDLNALSLADKEEIISFIREQRGHMAELVALEFRKFGNDDNPAFQRVLIGGYVSLERFDKFYDERKKDVIEAFNELYVRSVGKILDEFEKKDPKIYAQLKKFMQENVLNNPNVRGFDLKTLFPKHFR